MSHKHEYRGRQLTVRWDQHRCIHAAACVHGAPDVFDPKSKPWIDPDAASADHVAEVVHRCPTGALIYQRHDGEPDESLPEVNTLRLVADGPIYLRGNLRLNGKRDEQRVLSRMALCRCGASEHKPFCDGSHGKTGFEDAGRVGERRPKQEPCDESHLDLGLAVDGPVIVDGPFELVDADGVVVCRGSRCALCRCGASGSKPFCDGSHKKAGFEDPALIAD